MSSLGSNVPLAAHSAIAGAAQADQSPRAERRPAERPVKHSRRQDELDIDTAQSIDAIRSAKGNGEEAEEDRQSQDHYDPRSHQQEERPRLDVQG